MTKLKIIFSVGAFAYVLLLTNPLHAQSSPPKQPDTVNVDLGAALYADNCASCHGAKLEGQKNWQSPGPDGILPAPPHDRTGHTWHHGDALLFNYTKYGGQETLAKQGVDFKSGMPAFEASLSDQQIWDILAFLKSTWGDRINEIQKIRTRSEQQRGE